MARLPLEFRPVTSVSTTLFETTDGERFTTESEANVHQRNLNLDAWFSAYTAGDGCAMREEILEHWDELQRAYNAHEKPAREVKVEPGL